ncbi:MAG: hypothetical protein KGN30_01310, partial [Nitrospirota bacterium]|nr:hypothetical protein [Nitrospirota bacterium]
KAVVRYSRPTPLPAVIHALIIERWSEHRNSKGLKESADDFADLYQTLLNYEKSRDFPNPLIERTDIAKYHVSLSIRSENNDQHINRMMTRMWGEDWRAKLNKEMRAWR